jgi:hypothetical protein
MLSAIELSVIILTVVLLSVVFLNVVMLRVVILNVVMVSVMAPRLIIIFHYSFYTTFVPNLFYNHLLCKVLLVLGYKHDIHNDECYFTYCRETACQYA